MRQFLEENFTASAGANGETVIQISSAFTIGINRNFMTRARDAIVRLPNWQVKSKILEVAWEQPGFEIEGSLVSVYPDLSYITLKKWRHLQFLMLVLKRLGISYKRGFS